MGVICDVELQDGRTGERVRADLVTLADNHVADYEDIWLTALREYDEADQGLSWRFKQNLIKRHENWEGYAIEHRGLTQGLLLLETQTRWSRFSPGERLVRIDALVSAPWNRASIQRPRDFGGVGSALLAFAKQRSQALGYRGRVGLYSLPDAVGFYERQGMTQLELAPEDILDDEDTMPYFEYVVFPVTSDSNDDDLS